jgi:hypothetical protein
MVQISMARQVVFGDAPADVLRGQLVVVFLVKTTNYLEQGH